MTKIYFLEKNEKNKDLLNYLSKKHGFLSYSIDKYNKNIIRLLNDILLSLHKDDIIISDNLTAYYLYFACQKIENKVILINPYFFQKNGNLLTPSNNIIPETKNPNIDIIISENNPNLKNLKKLFKSENKEINIVDSVINSIDEIMKEIKKKDITKKNITQTKSQTIKLTNRKRRKYL